MRNLYVLLVYTFIIGSTTLAQSQDSLKMENVHSESAPVPIELFGGNKSFLFQLIVSKQFSANPRFGFFNVTNFMGDYQKVNQSSAFFSESLLTAEVWKGFSVTAGLASNGSSNTGLTVRPTAGLQYLFANRNFVIVILPRFDLSQTYNFETFAVLEYKPMLSKNWGIYSRLQGLYNYNTRMKFHEVSSIYLRLGVSYKNIQFGVGTNHDFYGSDYYNVNNFGLFIKTDLF